MTAKASLTITVEFDPFNTSAGEVQAQLAQALGGVAPMAAGVSDVLTPIARSEPGPEIAPVAAAPVPCPFPVADAPTPPAPPVQAPAAPTPPAATPEPPPPPATAPAVPEPLAADTKTDAKGVPHIPGIHAANKSVRADGTWKSARGVTEEERATAEAKATASAPPPPPTAPAPAPTPAPTPEVNYRDKVVDLVMAGRLDFGVMMDELKKHGLGNMMDASADQAKAIHDELHARGLV